MLLSTVKPVLYYRERKFCIRREKVMICASAMTEPKTKVERNENFAKLQAGYLFPEIARRRRTHQQKHPNAKIISLGIGDTTEPIPEYISRAMADYATGLSTYEGYSGYGAEQGTPELREALASVIYSGKCKPHEIFVSDGAKCDIGRLQLMFGTNKTVAIQDPSYPVYVDTSVVQGFTGGYKSDEEKFEGIQYMTCNVENGFFPDFKNIKRTDLVFFCSPNNPTGATATKEQLTELVDFVKKNGSILIYDAAYAAFISNTDCPCSIYDIPGAEEVAIETNSFSKYAGFTGVRLGWTVVPEALKYADGSSVLKDFNRIATTFFNGACNVAQAGGVAALSPEGTKAALKLVDYYKTNAVLLSETFKSLGFDVYGGTDAPYIWVHFPNQRSWDVFADILEKCDIVITPGSGFGPGGEGFIRVSAFGKRDTILEAIERFKKAFSK